MCVSDLFFFPLAYFVKSLSPAHWLLLYIHIHIYDSSAPSVRASGARARKPLIQRALGVSVHCTSRCRPFSRRRFLVVFCVKIEFDTSSRVESRINCYFLFFELMFFPKKMNNSLCGIVSVHFQLTNQQQQSPIIGAMYRHHNISHLHNVCVITQIQKCTTIRTTNLHYRRQDFSGLQTDFLRGDV